MGAKKRIAILLHEKDRQREDGEHFVWYLCELWRRWGIEVAILRGIEKYTEADLLIPHVDATVVPQAYLDFYQKYPRVVNRSSRDISKRRISRNLLSRGDGYDGPVIVKTNRNCGGITDLEFAGRKVRFSAKEKESAWSRAFNRSRVSSDWGEVNCLRSGEYPIFASLREVPEAAFANPSLVVERFLPERGPDGTFLLRYHIFLGDHGYCSVQHSRAPVVKHRTIFRRELAEIPAEIAAIRRELDLDYGKLDFVIHEGQVVLLDANTTPGNIATLAERREYAAMVAPGIHSLLSGV